MLSPPNNIGLQGAKKLLMLGREQTVGVKAQLCNISRCESEAFAAAEKFLMFLFKKRSF